MAIQQSHFRIRTVGGAQAINANGGGDWAADVDVNATLDMLVEHGGLYTRVRFELEEIDSTSTTIIPKLQYRINGGTWTDCADDTSVDDYDNYSNNTGNWPVVVTNSTVGFTDGAATTNIIDQSTKTFVAATGEHDTVGASITLNNEHTEIEWGVLIRRFYNSLASAGSDPRSAVSDGDTVEFRVVESDDTLLGGTYVIPTITVNVPAGYIGGTAVETMQNHTYIVTDAGTMYLPIEDGEAGAFIMMLKSTDGGDSWSIVDNIDVGDTDMESWSMSYDSTNDVIHMAHVGGACNYFKFATEDHGTSPDEWLEIGGVGVYLHELEASIDAANQSCEVILRGSTLYVFYSDLSTTDQVFYRKKPDLTDTNNWAARVSIDTTGGTTDFSGVSAVLGPNSDLIHIFYSDYSNFDVFHVSLNTSDTLGSKHTVETDLPSSNDSQHGMTNAISWYNGTVEKAMIGYVDETNGYLWTVIVENDGTPNTRQNASNSVVVLTDPIGPNSRQPIATLGIRTSNDTAYAVYVDDTSEDIWYATNADGAGWTGHTETQDGVACMAIRGQVFQHSSGNGSDIVLGYFTDNRYHIGGSNPYAGGAGTNRYDEIFIAAGAVDVADNQPAYIEGLRIFPFTEDFSVGSNDDPWRKSHWVTDVGIGA